jgi:hypothetical protein
MLAGRQDRHYLPGFQGARDTPRHGQLHRPDRDRPPLGHMMQERLVRTAAHPAPRDQLGSNLQAGPRMVVIEAEDARQIPVDRGRAPDPAPVRQHDHVARRGTQPAHEPGHVLNTRLVPAHRGVAEELEPQLQADRVSPHRVRRALDRRQVGKIALGGLHHLTVLPEQRPGLPAAAGHQHPLNEHGPTSVRPARPGSCLEGKLLAAVQGERHRAGCVVAGERGFGDGSGCGRVVCDDTVSVSDKGRPSPLPFPEARGGP